TASGRSPETAVFVPGENVSPDPFCPRPKNGSLVLSQRKHTKFTVMVATRRDAVLVKLRMLGTRELPIIHPIGGGICKGMTALSTRLVGLKRYIQLKAEGSLKCGGQSDVGTGSERVVSSSLGVRGTTVSPPPPPAPPSSFFSPSSDTRALGTRWATRSGA
ncbi:hypothetical protein BaRGS_00007482, partial [Batillaria attramentaria]